jgi:hypothetical protein
LSRRSVADIVYKTIVIGFELRNIVNQLVIFPAAHRLPKKMNEIFSPRHGNVERAYQRAVQRFPALASTTPSVGTSMGTAVNEPEQRIAPRVTKEKEPSKPRKNIVKKNATKVVIVKRAQKPKTAAPGADNAALAARPEFFSPVSFLVKNWRARRAKE